MRGASTTLRWRTSFADAVSFDGTPTDIVAVEAADHPSDREIVAQAKKYFKIAPPRVASASG